LSNTTGYSNTANGLEALYSNTTGTANTAIGTGALSGNTTGGENTVLGYNAGVSLTTGNNNIDIGNAGVAGDDRTIRIGGDPGGIYGAQTATFIAGINGVDKSSGSPVFIDSNGQLGTASPASLQGPPGPQGPAGPKGDTGDTGAQGAQGPTGAPGATGATGSAGPQGSQGPAGASPFTLNGTSAYYSSGNVGIGTTTPNAALEVDHDTINTTLVGTHNLELRLQDTGAGSATAKLGANENGEGGVVGMVSADDFRIFTSNSARVTVKSGGNVGIGTATPAAKLDVNGNIAVAGTPVIDANRNWVGNPTVPVGPGGAPINPLQVALLKWAPISGLSFPVGTAPYGVAFDGANVWVANIGTNNVTKLRASDGAVQGTFGVGSGPHGVAFDGTNIWVANFNSNSVTKLRASDGAVQGTFSVGTVPEGVAFDGANIWVINQDSNTVSKL